MIGTGQTLLCFAAELDGGLQSFDASVLGKSRQMLLPQYGLVLQRTLRPEDSFTFRRVGCSGCTDPESRSTRCNSCRASSNNEAHYARRSHAPQPSVMSSKTNAQYIVANPTNARLEIERLRHNVKGLRRARAREIFCCDLATNGRAVDGLELAQVRGAFNATNAAIQPSLLEGGAVKDLKLLRIHKEHLDRVSSIGASPSSPGPPAACTRRSAV